jgi:hypothetical protein
LICGEELAGGASAVLSFDGGAVRGRLVRFWRGDSVLELESVGSNGEGTGEARVRLNRRQEAERDVIAVYLLDEVARMLDERGGPPAG